MIEMQTVESKNIDKVGYDEDNAILRVQFHSGATWEYNGVPENVYESFLRAASIGNYFATRIRPVFGGVQV